VRGLGNRVTSGSRFERRKIYRNSNDGHIYVLGNRPYPGQHQVWKAVHSNVAFSRLPQFGAQRRPQTGRWSRPRSPPVSLRRSLPKKPAARPHYNMRVLSDPVRSRNQQPILSEGESEEWLTFTDAVIDVSATCIGIRFHVTRTEN